MPTSSGKKKDSSVSSLWDQLKKTGNPPTYAESMFGGKGTGKSLSSLLNISETFRKSQDSQKERYKKRRDLFREAHPQPYNDPFKAIPYKAIPYSDNYVPYQHRQHPFNGWIHEWYDGSAVPTSVATEKKKEAVKTPELDPEQIKGKFCAVATVITTNNGVRTENTGILFVKKCGHWKLCGYNGDKLVGGTSGNFEEDIKTGKLVIQIRLILYDIERVELEEGELEIV